METSNTPQPELNSSTSNSPVASPIQEATSLTIEDPMLHAEALVKRGKAFHQQRQRLLERQQKELAELNAEEQLFWSEHAQWLELFALERLFARSKNDSPSTPETESMVPSREGEYLPCISLVLSTGEIGFKPTPLTLEVENEMLLRQWVLLHLPEAGTWKLSLDGSTFNWLSHIFAERREGPSLEWYLTQFSPHIPTLLKYWLDSGEMPDGCRAEGYNAAFFVR